MVVKDEVFNNLTVTGLIYGTIAGPSGGTDPISKGGFFGDAINGTGSTGTFGAHQISFVNSALLPSINCSLTLSAGLRSVTSVSGTPGNPAFFNFSGGALTGKDGQVCWHSSGIYPNWYYTLFNPGASSTNLKDASGAVVLFTSTETATLTFPDQFVMENPMPIAFFNASGSVTHTVGAFEQLALNFYHLNSSTGQISPFVTQSIDVNNGYNMPFSVTTSVVVSAGDVFFGYCSAPDESVESIEYMSFYLTLS